jgi:hypothetical protein
VDHTAKSAFAGFKAQRLAWYGPSGTARMKKPKRFVYYYFEEPIHDTGPDIEGTAKMPKPGDQRRFNGKNYRVKDCREIPGQGDEMATIFRVDLKEDEMRGKFFNRKH